jgi:hypothetical protein
VGMGKGQESRLASHLVQYQHMASMAGPGLAAYSLTTSGNRRLSVLSYRLSIRKIRLIESNANCCYIKN